MLGFSLFAVPAFAETDEEEEERARKSDIVVTGIAQDDSYAPE